jgi:hypothetical protein
MRRQPMAMLKWILGGALAAYLGSAALLYAMQRDLLYRPRQTARTPPAAADFPRPRRRALPRFNTTKKQTLRRSSIPTTRQ